MNHFFIFVALFGLILFFSIISEITYHKRPLGMVFKKDFLLQKAGKALLFSVVMVIALIIFAISGGKR